MRFAPLIGRTRLLENLVLFMHIDSVTISKHASTTTEYIAGTGTDPYPIMDVHGFFRKFHGSVSSSKRHCLVDPLSVCGWI